MNKNKITFIILILVVIGVLIAGIFWRQKDKVSTILDDKNLSEINNGTVINQNNEIQTIESTNSFNIDKKIAIILSSELLPIDDWKVYKNKEFGYETKYPAEWYVFEPHPILPSGIVKDYVDPVYFSTMPNGELPNNRITPGSRIAFTIEKKSKEESLEQWLAKIGAIPAPGVDTMFQYVQLGDKKFLGTIDFDKSGWKNAYFEISEDKILKLSLMLQVADLNYSEIFYSMIDSLRIK